MAFCCRCIAARKDARRLPRIYSERCRLAIAVIRWILLTLSLSLSLCDGSPCTCATLCSDARVSSKREGRREGGSQRWRNRTSCYTTTTPPRLKIDSLRSSTVAPLRRPRTPRVRCTFCYIRGIVGSNNESSRTINQNRRGGCFEQLKGTGTH